MVDLFVLVRALSIFLVGIFVGLIANTSSEPCRNTARLWVLQGEVVRKAMDGFEGHGFAPTSTEDSLRDNFMQFMILEEMIKNSAEECLGR